LDTAVNSGDCLLTQAQTKDFGNTPTISILASHRILQHLVQTTRANHISLGCNFHNGVLSDGTDHVAAGIRPLLALDVERIARHIPSLNVMPFVKSTARSWANSLPDIATDMSVAAS
jgi:hypothetical protein